LAASAGEVRAFLGYRDEVDFPPRYDIAPPQPIAVVHPVAGERRFSLMRWGFVPAWIKDPGAISLLAVARAETLSEKPAFRGAYRYRRCLMPASGFYLWQRAGGRGNQPFFVSPATPGPIALAGLWETWGGADGSEIDTACLLTVAADPAIAAVSARTLVIIPPGDFDEWLSSPDSVDALLRPPRADLLSFRPVSNRIDSVKNDRPDLIAPVET
jgi:putative SOS response-associated peptidase YedK